jgi:hypothetical protein
VAIGAVGVALAAAVVAAERLTSPGPDPRSEKNGPPSDSPTSQKQAAPKEKPEPKEMNPLLEDQPLDGELTVHVWPKSRNQPDALDIRDARAVPLSAGDHFLIEATLNRPAYLYLLQIDSDGTMWSLFPWTGPRFEARGPESKRDKLKIPDDEDGEERKVPIADGSTGLETFLLFAREEKLADDQALRALFAKLPREGTAEFRGVLWLKNGAVVRAARDRKGRERGPLQLDKSRPVDQALPETRALLRGEMRTLFPYSVGVIFPREKMTK